MVKKIKMIVVSLSVLIFSSFSMTSIQASSDVSYVVKDDFGNEIMEVISFGSDDGTEWIEYIDFDTNKTYRSKLEDNIVTIVDLSDNSIFLTATINIKKMEDDISDSIVNNQMNVEKIFNAENTVVPSALIDDYDQWYGFGMVYESSMELSSAESATVSACISALTMFMGVGIVGSVAMSWVSSWAISEYNNNVKNFTKKVYRSTNKYCDILVKEYQEVYRGDGTKISTSAINTVWITTPWDYTTPAACRTLTERY